MSEGSVKRLVQSPGEGKGLNEEGQALYSS